MGTANSRPKFSGSNLSEARNTDAEKKPDANANAAKGDESDKGDKGESADKGKGAVEDFSNLTPEQQAEQIDGIKKSNLVTWGAVYQDFCELKEVKYKIQTTAKNQPSDIFVYTPTDVASYLSGKSDNPLTEYYNNNIDKIYLSDDTQKDGLEKM